MSVSLLVVKYAEAGRPWAAVLVLIPGKTASWWGYEKAMKIL